MCLLWFMLDGASCPLLLTESLTNGQIASSLYSPQRMILKILVTPRSFIYHQRLIKTDVYHQYLVLLICLSTLFMHKGFIAWLWSFYVLPLVLFLHCGYVLSWSLFWFMWDHRRKFKPCYLITDILVFTNILTN